LRPNEGKYPEACQLALEKYETGIKDGHWKARQAWVKFMAPQIKDGESGLLSLLPALSSNFRPGITAESTWLTRIFDIAIGDVDGDVRTSALDVLQQLLKDCPVLKPS
jgi:hypothetical protein